VLLTACGGGDGRDSVVRGHDIFVRSCASCHTLTRHDTRARGGDLGQAKLSIRAIDGFVRVMPVRLSDEETKAVAAYVHAEAGRRRGR
jgi:mono/diheme cytochrome c family protein